MAKIWTIYGKRVVDESEQTVAIAVVHDIEFRAEWLDEVYVTVSVKSPVPIDWHFGDYLTYRGEVFSINYDPNVVKNAKSGSYDEGFTYDNIKFFFLGDKLKDIKFKDVVLSDNDIPYTSLGTFSFYAASVEDLADRLQANTDRDGAAHGFKFLTPSSDRTRERLGSLPEIWNTYYTGTEDEGEKDVNVSIDNQFCWEVLRYAYDKFGLSYFISGNYVIIGGKPIHLNTGSQNIFRYGKGLGLYEIERTSDEDQEIVTKLFAYGSEQNLPLNYYANIGKRVKFKITRKSKKTYISGHPTYYLWTDEEWVSTLKKAFPADSTVVLTFGDYSGTFHFTGSDTVYDDDAPTVELDKTCLNFYWIDYGEQDEHDLYNHVSVNDYVYVTGVDINLMPAKYIELPEGYDYPAALSVNRLMLPGFPNMTLHDWVSENHPELLSMYRFSGYDAITAEEKKLAKKDPWIKSMNVEYAGIIEGTANYDGSSQQEIYPTIENTEAGVVVADTEIVDNGYLNEKDDIGFTLKVANSILNWKDALNKALEDVYIEMKSGFCIGCRFKVKSANLVDGVWELSADRHQDPDSKRYMPYYEDTLSKFCQVKDRDKFVVTGIQMPDAYIEAAAEKLLIAACGYLDRRDHMRYTYIPKIDELFMQRNFDNNGALSYHDIIHEGMMLEFEDTDLGIWHTPYIDQLTIHEDGLEGIPSYEVVLRDEKEKGALEKMAERIEELTGATQVVERQTYPSMNVDYSEWVAGTPYYYQTLNTNPNPDISTSPYIETSYVWHRGKKWMCLRTLTNEEPMLGCSDWKVVEGDTGYAIEFVSSNGYSFYQGHVSTTVDAYLYWGTEDITDQVAASQFNWTRSSESGKTEADVAWDAMAAHQGTKQLTLTDADMPTAWSRTNKAIFTLTVTVSEDVHVVNNIIA